MKKKNILIIDDEESVRESLKFIFQNEYNVFFSANGKQGVDQIEKGKIDLVFLDLVLPDSDGLEILKKIHADYPELPVIVMSGYRKDVRDAVDVMKFGAYDFLAKPFKTEEITVLTKEVIHAIESKELKEEVKYLREEINKTYELETIGEIVGESNPIKAVLETINKVKDTDSSVLIQGETGTGKELVARALHYNSYRKEKPFIVIHCAAISTGLFESELFGHEKGAFTGAIKTKKGSFEIADGGTVFLDEIGEIPIDIQVKLLRVLQEKSFRRVGGTETIEVDIRLVAATNKNLAEIIKTGRFRKDLYYRLDVIPIRIPTLKERKEDLHILVEHFLELFRKKMSIPKKHITNDALEILKKYDWPGNVRELENVLERLCVTIKEDIITAEHIKGQIGFMDYESIAPDIDKEDFNLKNELDKYEKAIIEKAMQKTDGRVKDILKILNISKQVYYYKLKSLGINH